MRSSGDEGGARQTGAHIGGVGELRQLLPAVQVARPAPGCPWVFVRAHPDAWRALQPSDLPCLRRRLAPLEPVLVCEPDATVPPELAGADHVLRLAIRVDRSLLRWGSPNRPVASQQRLSLSRDIAVPPASTEDRCPNCGSTGGFDQVARCLTCRQPCPSYL